ncbi:unnamed protein product [Gongylonema pulchrum]|uniref:Secreted protein n=1 Tax=Gongylonema pulchrum TaxID=637853 RepID=A0A183E6H7_9BILA|nr:unnamed protein product [Gongylonema pulchrum]
MPGDTFSADPVTSGFVLSCRALWSVMPMVAWHMAIGACGAFSGALQMAESGAPTGAARHAPKVKQKKARPEKTHDEAGDENWEKKTPPENKQSRRTLRPPKRQRKQRRRPQDYCCPCGLSRMIFLWLFIGAPNGRVVQHCSRRSSSVMKNYERLRKVGQNLLAKH